MQRKIEYSDTPRYEGQPRKLTPYGKRVLAAIACGTALFAGGLAISKEKEIKNFFDDTFYSSVDKSVDGPMVEPNGNGRPEVLLPPDDVKMTEVTIPQDKSIALVESARLRTSPAFGDEDTGKTTMATLGEQVLLTDIDSYTLCEYPNGDRFAGFLDAEMKEIFPNVKIEEDGDGETWVNAGELRLVDKPTENPEA